MSGTAVLCSGQGPQGRGMFDVLASAAEAAPVFKAATAALGGKDPRKLVESGTDAELHGNKVAQILCCTQALAAWAVIESAVPRPLVVAGYSVGELAAWGVAGVLDAEGVLALAAARAEAMDAATKQPSGLLAVRGLSRHDVDAICKRRDAHVAIVDAPDVFLLGGTEPALSAAEKDATAKGAQRTTRLAVAVPSHTPLLRPASAAFRKALHRRVSAVKLPGDVRLLSGIDGNAVFSAAGLDKLADQVSSTVEWVACMDACREAGIAKAVELGPGAALAHMMRDSVEGVRKWRGGSKCGRAATIIGPVPAKLSGRRPRSDQLAPKVLALVAPGPQRPPGRARSRAEGRARTPCHDVAARRRPRHTWS